MAVVTAAAVVIVVVVMSALQARYPPPAFTSRESQGVEQCVERNEALSCHYTTAIASVTPMVIYKQQLYQQWKPNNSSS